MNNEHDETYDTASKICKLREYATDDEKTLAAYNLENLNAANAKVEELIAEGKRKGYLN